MPTLTFTQVTESEHDIKLVVGLRTNADIFIPKGSAVDHGTDRSVHIRTPEKTNRVSFYINPMDFREAQEFCKTDRERFIECSTRAGAYRGAIQEMLRRTEPITMTISED